MSGTTSDSGASGGDGPERDVEFEASLDRLEEIVARLDREELELDEALSLFEEGVGHLREASRLLDEAHGVVEELIEEASGELETVDFDLPSRDAEDGNG